jgi:hypothetical protein
MSYLKFIPITVCGLLVTGLALAVKFGYLASTDIFGMPATFLAILISGFSVTVGMFIKNWRVILALLGAVFLSWAYVYLLFILK